MMISERTVIIIVTLISMFGISYCYGDNNDTIELPYPYETLTGYNVRTDSLYEKLKVSDADFFNVQAHYRTLIENTKDFEIWNAIYPVLPELGDFEGDFMMKILSLGNCGFSLQAALINYMLDRVGKLNSNRIGQNSIFTSKPEEAPTTEAAQEISFLGEKLSMTNVNGRMKDIFMNSFYGTRQSDASDKNDDKESKCTKCLNLSGKWIFDVAFYKKQTEMLLAQKTQVEESKQSGESCNCSLQNFMLGSRVNFQNEHSKTYYEKTDMDSYIKGQSITEKSDWLSNLKKTKPLFGESYFSYVSRTLKRKRTPLPASMLVKYHGDGYALNNKFQVWPELNSTFIMYYLFNCPIAGVKHHSYIDVDGFTISETAPSAVYTRRNTMKRQELEIANAG